ncbi:MAG TPA: hypothetical protein DDY24_11845, partial [Alcaligenaceae bacterium]|nr:hypothetical protein [Alcaligenaceae bacterium]
LMGARPMQRLIQDTIRRALADELLFGKLSDGGSVIVDLDANDKVVLSISERALTPTTKSSGSDQEAELVH